MVVRISNAVNGFWIQASAPARLAREPSAFRSRSSTVGMPPLVRVASRIERTIAMPPIELIWRSTTAASTASVRQASIAARGSSYSISW